MYKLLTLGWFFSCTVIFFSCIKEHHTIPTANAGPDKSITLPIDTVTLSGSGSAGADSYIVSYLWSQVSGPSASIILNPGSSSPLIKNSVPGRYVFQLSVTDSKGITGVDSAVVLVNPPVTKVLTIETSMNPDELTLINNNGQGETSRGGMDIAFAAWTKYGASYLTRGVIKFDLSTIPTNANVISANLFLYSYPAPTLNGNFIDANFGSNNAFLVHQIISNWSPASISWFNQPQISPSTQIVIPSTTQSVLDMDINVTDMISSMVKNNANYGFLLKIQSEQIYNCRIFISSYNTTYITKHPKLVIQYK